MKVKKTVVTTDLACSSFKKSISLIEVENIKAFIKAKEVSIGTRNIDAIEYEIYDGVSHKLTVHQNDIYPLFGDAERTIIYEWED